MLMVATALAVAIFLLTYLYLPMHRQVTSLATAEDKLRQEILGLEQKWQEERRAVERIKALHPFGYEEKVVSEGLQERLQDHDPNRERLSLFLKDLNRMARAAAVEFISVRPQAVKEEDSLSQQSVLIQTRSTFRGIERYLRMLENLPRLLNVENLKIESDPSEASYVLAELALTVYWERGSQAE